MHRGPFVVTYLHRPPHTTVIRSTIASPISRVPTAVGSSRFGFRSYVTDLPSAITADTARSTRSAAWPISMARA